MHSILHTEFPGLSPYHSLSEPAQVFAQELAQELGTSEEMVSCTLLAMFAAGQIGSECEISKSHRIGLSLYMAIGAEPSSGKTPIMKRMKPILDNLISKHIALPPDEIATRRARRDLLSSRIKGIKTAFKKKNNATILTEDINELADLQKELAAISIPQAPLMGKMSPQSFIKELSLRNGLGILLDDEGAPLSSFHRINPDDITPFLDAWSNTTIEDITKHEQFYAKSPSVVLLCMWQTRPLLKFFRTPEYSENGLTARFLPFIMPAREPRTGYGQASATAERWFADQLEQTIVQLKECRTLTGCHPKFHLSHEANVVLKNFQTTLTWQQRQNMPFGNHHGIAGKLPVHAVRLAMTLHAMETTSHGNMEIDMNTMHRACNLAMFFGMQSATIINTTNQDEMRKQAQPLIMTIANSQQFTHIHHGYTTTELCRPHGLSKKKCERILFWMMAQGWIYPQQAQRPLPTGSIESCEIWVPHFNFCTLL